MAKMTLLAMVQNILSDMDSDQVNSITDSAEALQVAEAIRTAYYNLITTRKWPHLITSITLTSTGDPAKKVHLLLPNTVDEIQVLKYDKREYGVNTRAYKDVTYLEPAEFLNKLNTRDSESNNCEIVTDYSGMELIVINDKHPDYYTIISSRSYITGGVNTGTDQYVVFDSYDSESGTAVVAARTQVQCYIEPPFTMSDGFVPDFPAKNFPYLLAEAKSSCFNNLKQSPNGKEEQWTFRHKIWSAREKHRNPVTMDTPNYGRRSGTNNSSKISEENINTMAGENLPSWWPS